MSKVRVDSSFLFGFFLKKITESTHQIHTGTNPLKVMQTHWYTKALTIFMTGLRTDRLKTSMARCLRMALSFLQTTYKPVRNGICNENTSTA